MSKFQGTIATIARVGAGVTGGITGNTTVTFTSILPLESTTTMWDGSCYGISVTTIGSQAFSCYVVGNLGSVQVPIAGLSGIATTASTILPLVNERIIGTANGTTQVSFQYGIPTPAQAVFGNSATPGQSYSAIVYAMQYKIS